MTPRPAPTDTPQSQLRIENPPASPSAAILELKRLTEHDLPRRAQLERWPVRLDHCFKRICFDHAFGDVWHQHIPRPAEQNLAGVPLRRALTCARAILHEGLPALLRYNGESLCYRGKTPRHHSHL